MAASFKFRGHINEAGKFHMNPSEKTRMYEFAESHKRNTQLDIVIGPHKKYRSNPQLKYYFSVVVKTLSNELGYQVDEMHDILKHMFNPQLIDVRGYCVEMGGSTGDLKTDEMEDYLSKIRMWASADLGIYIPLPNESTEV